MCWCDGTCKGARQRGRAVAAGVARAASSCATPPALLSLRLRPSPLSALPLPPLARPFFPAWASSFSCTLRPSPFLLLLLFTPVPSSLPSGFRPRPFFHRIPGFSFYSFITFQGSIIFLPRGFPSFAFPLGFSFSSFAPSLCLVLYTLLLSDIFLFSPCLSFARGFLRLSVLFLFLPGMRTPSRLLVCCRLSFDVHGEA